MPSNTEDPQGTTASIGEAVEGRGAVQRKGAAFAIWKIHGALRNSRLQPAKGLIELGDCIVLHALIVALHCKFEFLVLNLWESLGIGCAIVWTRSRSIHRCLYAMHCATGVEGICICQGMLDHAEAEQQEGHLHHWDVTNESETENSLSSHWRIEVRLGFCTAVENLD